MLAKPLINMKMGLICMKSTFTCTGDIFIVMNGSAQRVILTWQQKETPKWPISTKTDNRPFYSCLLSDLASEWQ